MYEHGTKVDAIVANKPVDGKLNLRMEKISLRELQPDEVLVRTIATGICHTDLIFGAVPEGYGSYPRILGHEGAGYVTSVGAEIKSVKAGDMVLMSFSSCSTCRDCLDEHPSYCQKFGLLNYMGEQGVFTTDNSRLAGLFFGQSSFSSLTIVRESSIVNVSGLVKAEEELKLFAPLGCGFQTGMGTVEVLAKATANDSIVVLGLGGVGLAAVIAAKLRGCHTIIGVDRFATRLELAKTLGATSVIDTSNLDVDLAKKIQGLTDGAGSTITIDTTGNVALITSGVEFTSSRGQMIILGAPSIDAQLTVPIVPFMQTGKIIRGSIEGDVNPQKYIPRMIQLYREGKFPLEKLVKRYSATDFELAIAEMKSGHTIKPILVW